MSDQSIRAPSRRLLQNHDTLVVWAQRLLNIAAVVVPLMYLAQWRDGEIKDNYRYMAVVAVLLMLVIYQQSGVYRRFSGPIEGVQQRLAQRTTTTLNLFQLTRQSVNCGRQRLPAHGA